MEWNGLYDAQETRLDMAQLTFPAFLNSSMAMLLAEVDRYVECGEDLFTKFVYKDEEAINLSKILWNMKIPLSFLLILLAGLILAIIGLPLLYLYKKRAKSINALQYQVWFCIESFILLTSCVFLCIGLVIYIKIANQMLTAGWAYPDMIYTLVNSVNAGMDDYKLQVDIVNHELWHMQSTMKNDIHLLPDKLKQCVHDHLSPDIDSCLGIINQSIALFNIGRIPQVTDYEATDFLHFGCNFLDKSSTYEKEVVRQNYTALYKKSENSTLADLSLLYQLMDVPQEIYNTFKMRFGDDLEQLSASIKDNLIHVDITNNVANILEQFREPLNYINVSAAYIETFTQNHIIGSMPFLNISKFQVLIYMPTIYCVSFLICLFIGCAFSLWTLKRVVAAKNSQTAYNYATGTFTANVSQYMVRRPLKILKITLTIALFFLWLLFTLAIMFYTLLWPLNLICKSEVIQKKYLNMWNETEVYHHIQKDMALTTEDLQHIFKVCRANKTIIVGLNLHQNAVEDFYVAIDTNQWLTALTSDLNDDYSNTIAIDQLWTESKRRLRAQPAGLTVSNKTKQMCKSLLAGNGTGGFEFSSDFLDLVASNWRDNEYQEKIILLKMYNRHLSKQMDSMGTAYRNFIDEVAFNLSHNSMKMRQHAHYVVENDLGKCYIIPYAYETVKWLVCDHMLFIVTGLCISLTVMGFSMILCIFLTSRILKYLTGAFEHLNYVEKSKHRYSSDKSRRITLGGVKLALQRKMREQKNSEEVLNQKATVLQTALTI